MIALVNKEALRSTLLSQLCSLCNQERLTEAISTLHNLVHGSATVHPQILSRVVDLAVKFQSVEHVSTIHSLIRRNHAEFGRGISAKLINAYGKCGRTDYARNVLDQMHERDICSYNAMLHGYSRNCLFDDVLHLFHQLERTEIRPDGFTFPCVLKAVGALSNISEGRRVHGKLIKLGYGSRLTMGNSLISMYSTCCAIEYAKQAFNEISQRDVVSWNSMIAGYEKNGLWNKAFDLFLEMIDEGTRPDSVTIVSVLAACTESSNLKSGMWIHKFLKNYGFPAEDILVNNAFIALFAKCNCMDLACQIFHKMPERDIFTWTSMISGYAQAGNDKQALIYFQWMHVSGIGFNRVTFTSLLPVCAGFASLKLGRVIHGLIIRILPLLDDFLACALLDMYCKCGNLTDARQLFGETPQRKIVSWNAMIGGYGMHGNGKEALYLFEQMEIVGVRPNHVTFVALLSACSHAGMVQEGRHYFDTVMDRYKVPRKTEHYACMVDLLGRAGHLEDAFLLIQKIPFRAESDVWGALLGACRIHGNAHLGEYAAQKLFELKPRKAGYYVLLSNLYASTGKWEGIDKLKVAMRAKGMSKDFAFSWIELDKNVHVFAAGDKEHSKSDEIYGILSLLQEHIQGVKSGEVLPCTKSFSYFGGDNSCLSSTDYRGKQTYLF